MKSHLKKSISGFVVFILFILQAGFAQNIFWGIFSNYDHENKEGIVAYYPATGQFVVHDTFKKGNMQNPLYTRMAEYNGKLYGVAMGSHYFYNYPKFRSVLRTNNPSLAKNTASETNYGVIFCYDLITSETEVLQQFLLSEFGIPQSSLTLASNGKFYGITKKFIDGFGVITPGRVFEFDPAVNSLNFKMSIYENNHNSFVVYNQDKLLIQLDNSLYEYNINSQQLILKNQISNQFYNSSDLILASDGNIYFFSDSASTYSNSTLVKYNYLTNSFQFYNTTQRGLGNRPNPPVEIGGKLYWAYLETLSSPPYPLYVGCFNLANQSISYIPTFIPCIPGFVTQNGANGKLFITLSYSPYMQNVKIIFSFDPVTQNTDSVFSDSLSNWGEIRGGMMQSSNGKLYGLARYGGSGLGSSGILFGFDINTNTLTKEADLNINSDGLLPVSGLLKASNNKLYGVTVLGGNYGKGTIFEFDLNTFKRTKVYDFTGLSGANPTSRLIEMPNGIIYGTTSMGGLNNMGVLFSFDKTLNMFQKLVDCDSLTMYPEGSLNIFNGKLIGVSPNGGVNGTGSLFEYDPATNNLSIMYSFFTTPSSIYPVGMPLVKPSNGFIYGIALDGKNIYRYKPQVNTFSSLAYLNINDGQYMILHEAPNGKFYMVNNYALLEFNINGNIVTTKQTYNEAWGSPQQMLFASDSLYYFQQTKFTWNNTDPFNTNIVRYDYINNSQQTIAITTHDIKGSLIETNITCLYADLPVLQASSQTVCSGNPVVLRVISGNLNSATHWQWYENNCLINPIGQGDSIVVYPQAATMYFATGEGGCSYGAPCASIAINTQQLPSVTVTASGPLTFCMGDSVVLSSSPAVTYQWKRNSVIIPGATQSQLVVKKAGSYTVEISDGQCSNISAPKKVYVPCLPTNRTFAFNENTTPVSLFEMKVKYDYASKQVQIICPTCNDKTINVVIMDVSGRILFAEQIERSQKSENSIVINKQILSPGIYFCSVLSDEKSVTGKFAAW